MRRSRTHSRTRARRRIEPGFTLVEALAAMLILAVGLLGVAGLVTGTIRVNFSSTKITSATVVAKTQLEAVRNAGYASINSTNFPSSAATISMGGTSFSRTTAITDNSPATNMKTISVTVSWREANNFSPSLNFQTIVAK